MDQSTDPPKKRRRGRPKRWPPCTPAERRDRNRASTKKYRLTAVHLSEAFRDWKELKAGTGWTHGELAAHLMDVHQRYCNCNQANSKPTGKSSDDVPVADPDPAAKILASYRPIKTGKSSDDVPVADPDPAAKILASYRPIRTGLPSDNVVPVANPGPTAKILATCGPVSTGKSSDDVIPVADPGPAAKILPSYGPIRTGLSSDNVVPVANPGSAAKILATYGPIRTGLSSENVVPVADPGPAAKILAAYGPIRVGKTLEQSAPPLVHLANMGVSYIPIRSNEFTAPSAPVTVNRTMNLIIQPSPVRNQIDAVNLQSYAASVSSNTILVPQNDANKTSVEVKKEEGEEGNRDPGGDVQMKKTQILGDSVHFQGKESHEKDTDVEAEEGIEIILNDNVDGEGCSSEEDESIKEKRQKFDRQVTDSSIRRSDLAAVARVVGVPGGTGNNKNRTNHESSVLGVTGSVSEKRNVPILPKPVGNKNDASKMECNSFLESVSTTVAAQGDLTESSKTGHEKQQEQEVEDEKRESPRDVGELETAQGEAEVEEATSQEEVVASSKNLEPDETDAIVGNDSDQMDQEAEPNWAEGNIEIVLNFDDDDDDEDRDEEDYSSEEDESLREKRPKLDHQVTDLPFKRFELSEVAKAEGFPGTGSSKCKLKKLYWTEMERIYRCKICPFENSSAYVTSRHLIQEHDDVVNDLVEYLKERPAKESEPGRSLYDTVMEFSPPDGSDGATNEDDVSPAGLEQETGSVAIPEEASKAIESKPSEGRSSKKSNDALDTVESVELLKRWVRLQISCQFCQLVISCRLFTQKGENAVHRCRQGKHLTTLCDICGKLFSYGTFRSHWLSVHGSHEETICQFCGKTVRSGRLSHHIMRCHTISDCVYECGICKKEFRTKSSRAKHEVIHQKEKPFKCSYCQRGFTQSSNMRYHMRQHTGEKPYRCEKCTESFAHNVSLKNHLKIKHGIDPWKMGSVGD